MKLYEARSASDLGEIINRVHDRCFELEEVVYDETQNILRIPIAVIDKEISASRNIFLVKVHTHPICAANLIIHTVSRFEIVDQAKTGQGDINTIDMEGDSTRIRGQATFLSMVRKEKVGGGRRQSKKTSLSTFLFTFTV